MGDRQARLLSTLLVTGDELSITDLAKRAGLAYPTPGQLLLRCQGLGADHGGVLRQASLPLVAR
jgi:hypothetical protein